MPVHLYACICCPPPPVCVCTELPLHFLLALPVLRPVIGVGVSRQGQESAGGVQEGLC